MKIGIVVIIVFLPMLIFCQNFDFTFEENNQGWVGFFSDYEVGEEEGYELEFLHYNLPFPLDTTKGSMIPNIFNIGGLNPSNNFTASSNVLKVISFKVPGCLINHCIIYPFLLSVIF